MLHDHLVPGFVIANKYVIDRTIGRGGMGTVYVASHATTGKRVALKCLSPELVHNADMVGRFMREAQVMGRLQHRHVVDVYDVGRDGDVLFIVMELLDGKPLSDLLHDERLTLEEALVVLLRSMEGVAAAHEHGVVHRDLKPDNIFVTVGPTGQLDDPRVLDFGISKLDDSVMEPLTRSGVAMGTPYYMSIEQLNGQRDLDARVDVYAMGIILYEAIAGHPPYQADSISALAIRVLTSEPTHLGRLRPDLPPGLADVVMKAMARSRDDRFRSMRQLIVALKPFVPQSAGVAVPEGRGVPLRTPMSGNHRLVSSVQPSSRGLRSATPHGLPSTTSRPSSRPPRTHDEEDDYRVEKRSSWGKLLALALLVLIGSGVAAVVARRSLIDATGTGGPVLPALPDSPRATPSDPAPKNASTTEAPTTPKPATDPAASTTPPATPTNAPTTPTTPSANAAPTQPAAPPAQTPARPPVTQTTQAGSAPATPAGAVGKRPPLPVRPTGVPPLPPPPVVTGEASPNAQSAKQSAADAARSAEGRAGKLDSNEF